MLCFYNPGQLDLTGLTTFGLSSKDDSQIGRFGTGLKYASAVILRAGGSIRFIIGGKQHVLGVEPAMFRGKPTAYATLDGQRLAFTIDLGKDWKPWMAFREFYSNAMDEGGGFLRDKVCEAETQIIIECPALDAVHDNFEEFFIDPLEAPIWENDELQIFRGESNQMFYKGFAIFKTPKRSAFRYNILEYVDLTEDRTAAYSWQVLGRIENQVLEIDNEEILTRLLHHERPIESMFSFSTSADPSPAFIKTVAKLGEDASAPSRLFMARWHMQQKSASEILEASGNSSVNLAEAVAGLSLLLPNNKLKFAYYPIEEDRIYREHQGVLLISDRLREDLDATYEAVFRAAWAFLGPDPFIKKMIRTAQEIMQNA